MSVFKKIESTKYVPDMKDVHGFFVDSALSVTATVDEVVIKKAHMEEIPLDANEVTFLQRVLKDWLEE